MLIRAFKPGEEEGICALLRFSITKTFAKDYPDCNPVGLERWLANKTPENILKWFKSEENCHSVIEVNGAIIGVGLLNFVSGCLHLCYLHPDFWGQGMGIKLLCHLEEQAIKNGCSKIHFVATPGAEGFYERWGAVKYGEELNASEEVYNPKMEKILQ